MSTLLLWLAVPLLLLPVVALPGRLGAATGRMVMAGLGLGAMAQGAGSLDPSDLRYIASQSPHSGWFVGLTIGVLVTGACIAADARSWRTTALAGPLLVGLVFSIVRDEVVAILVGALIGLLPSVLARALPHKDARPTASQESGRSPVRRSVPLLLGALTIVSAWLGPLAVAMAALCALDWYERPWRDATRGESAVPGAADRGDAPARERGSGSPLPLAARRLISFGRFAADAPVSAAASVVLALLAIGWGIAIAAPWPLDRFADVSVQLPVLGVVFYLAMHATPDGTAHWQPLLSVIMVPAAIVAVSASSLGRRGSRVVVARIDAPGTSEPGRCSTAGGGTSRPAR